MLTGSGGYIKLQSLQALLRDIEYCQSLLKGLPTVDVPSMKVSREGVFFAGQYFDALNRIAEILSPAKSTITIVDGYLDESVLNLLTSKARGVSISLLTKASSPALRTAATAFQKQYGNLSIRTSPAFHDRFVIIDDSEFYHLGASIKDAGHRGFMFSRIEEPAVIDAFRKKLSDEWSKATVVI